MLTIGDNKDYSRVLFYSYYTTIAGPGVYGLGFRDVTPRTESQMERPWDMKWMLGLSRGFIVVM